MKQPVSNLPAPPDRGFVLVGVVMMVLALTILGLSLFSLSSYEAQFFDRTLSEAQALQFAMGGLDRSRFALSVAPQNMSQVRANLPEGVIYARAHQNRPGGIIDSLGPVLPTPDSVEISVTAQHHGILKSVAGTYDVAFQENYYKRLMTVGDGGIEVNQFVGALLDVACGTVKLGTAGTRDSIWENRPSSSWTTCAVTATSTYGINNRFVPVPSVTSFISTHPGTPLSPNLASYSLSGPPGGVGYYYTDNPGPGFSSRHPSLTINVTGRVVWMLSHGLRSDGFVHITGNPSTSCLVIVAHDGHDVVFNLFGAIWFFAGLQADIPVIFVSDGTVKLEHFFAIAGATRANNISIFAKRVLLTGPALSPLVNLLNNRMELAYGATTVMDDHIDALMAARALPNSVSSNIFALRPGTWRVLQ